MGIRHGKRKRLESLKEPPIELLVALGEDNIDFEKFDIDLLYDKINARLDIQQKKILDSFSS